MTAHRADEHPPALPPGPIDQILNPLVRFLHVEAASGIVLLLATAIALVLANTSVSAAFLGFWKTPIGIQVGHFEFRHSLQHLINDGLMVIFFFVVGLEVKRELVLGELRGFRRAALPVAAAIGGMLVPAGIYLLLRAGKPGAHGWGIPMATDIAFVVGCMAVLGSRVPHGLRVMLLTLAIADDIGAILVIAIGYTHGLNLHWLMVGLAGFGVVLAMARLGVRGFTPYVVVGAVIWYAFHESGIHATISGVILGLMTPTYSRLGDNVMIRLLDRAKATFESGIWRNAPNQAEQVRRFQHMTREIISPSGYLINVLHPWVSFVIMPLFALANAGVAIRGADLGAPVAVAVLCGLFIGKPVGVFLASLAAVKSGIARLPDNVTWPQMAGGGLLAGIGFTMALFIAGLALKEPLLDTAKVGVLAGSLVSAVGGTLVLMAVKARSS
ncbi:MAG: Na+/H+ antiporter NhaA [Tepidisphaeraceae bacterium]|jgi:NhaA family Na+:H+ antiporter